MLGSVGCLEFFSLFFLGELILLMMFDRDFAANAGIAFLTPEEYFLGEAQRPFQRTFDLEALLQPEGSEAVDDDSSLVRPAFEKKHDQELVLLCGSPGAGKSTFYHHILQPLGYKRVNQDILKSVRFLNFCLKSHTAKLTELKKPQRDKCLKVAAECLASGDSIAVDNTNADADTRHHWIVLAQKHSLPIRAVHLTTPVAVCQHNDAVRAGHYTPVAKKSAQEKDATKEDLTIAFNPEKRTLLPPVAFTSFVSRFIPPSMKEGFSEVLTVPFVFSGSEAARKVWGRYWI